VPEIHSLSSAMIEKRHAAYRQFFTGFSTAVEKRKMTPQQQKNNINPAALYSLKNVGIACESQLFFLQRARKVTHEVRNIQQKKTIKIFFSKNENKQYWRGFQKCHMFGSPENKGNKKNLTKWKFLMKII